MTDTVTLHGPGANHGIIFSSGDSSKMCVQTQLSFGPPVLWSTTGTDITFKYIRLWPHPLTLESQSQSCKFYTPHKMIYCNKTHSFSAVNIHGGQKVIYNIFSADKKTAFSWSLNFTIP